MTSRYREVTVYPRTSRKREVIGWRRFHWRRGRVSKAYAYKVIRRLNAELESEGMLTIPGKVSAAYLESRYFGEAKRSEGDAHVG